MNTFILKLVLAPIIIGSASWAGRKWGPAVSGWIVGLPLTSGPVLFFLALSEGKAFAANATLGVISGGISLVSYVLTYTWLANRSSWQASITGSLLAYLTCTAILQNFAFPLIPIVIICLSGNLVGIPINSQ